MQTWVSAQIMAGPSGWPGNRLERRHTVAVREHTHSPSQLDGAAKATW